MFSLALPVAQALIIVETDPDWDQDGKELEKYNRRRGTQSAGWMKIPGS
jgi:hypothetical protein